MIFLRKNLVILGLAVSAIASAQNTEVELDPVTITSSLNPIQASRTGRNILVIKGEQFQNLPVNSLDELIRYIPGFEVQARGPMGAQSDFVIRGGTFQQVLVIIDGIRVNDPVTGHFSSYIPIVPSEIERIEILKGASSAIYGSEAVGGVVHIISKTFAANSSAKNNLQGGITVGEFGLLNANVGGYFTGNKTKIYAGALSNNADGQPQRGIKGYLNLNTASVSLSHKLNDHWQASFRTSFDKRSFAAQNFYTTFASDTAEEKVTTFWNHLQLNYRKNNHKLIFNVGYKSTEDEYLYNKSLIANNNKSDLWQGLLVYERSISENTIITTGAQFQNKKIESNDRGNHALNETAFFVTANQILGDFSVNPAVRLDYNKLSKLEFVPQINLSYSKNNFQLRGSAGKTVRNADFTERYNNYNKPFVASGRIGNPDLKAETSFSYEAGADYILSSKLKISSTWFQRFHEKLIDWSPTPYALMPRRENLSPLGSYALAKNVSSVNTKGFETDVQYNQKLSNNTSVWSSVGFVWLDSESSDATPSFYISSHAKLLVNWNVALNTKWFSMGVNGLYKSRDPQAASAIKAEITKDYIVFNTKLEAKLLKNKLGIFIQVDNVLDETYSDLLGSKMPQRWIMFGARVSL